MGQFRARVQTPNLTHTREAYGDTANARVDGDDIGVEVCATIVDGVESFDVVLTGGTRGRMIGGRVATITLDPHGAVLVRQKNGAVLMRQNGTHVSTR